jgi:hypothetical protein
MKFIKGKYQSSLGVVVPLMTRYLIFCSSRLLPPVKAFSIGYLIEAVPKIFKSLFQPSKFITGKILLSPV